MMRRKAAPEPEWYCWCCLKGWPTRKSLLAHLGLRRAMACSQAKRQLELFSSPRLDDSQDVPQDFTTPDAEQGMSRGRVW